MVEILRRMRRNMKRKAKMDGSTERGAAFKLCLKFLGECPQLSEEAQQANDDLRTYIFSTCYSIKDLFITYLVAEFKIIAAEDCPAEDRDPPPKDLRQVKFSGKQYFHPQETWWHDVSNPGGPVGDDG